MSDSPVFSTIDYGRPGKQIGQIRIPRSTNESGWSHLFLPVICIANGRGPTALVTGGVHGDEPEGQIAALNLARTARPEDVRGRLIILPCLSPEASRAYTRLWPSGANLNRSFPGRPDGSPDQQLADYMTRMLFPLADVICDIHSGGRSMLCLPWSEIHLVDDRAQRAAMLEAMLAWNTDYHFVYINIAGGGLLVDEAERQGKVVVGTELGGGGHVTARIHRLAERGLANFLRHAGILSGAVVTRASLGLGDPVILRALEIDDYLLAPESGLFETLVALGDSVAAGQTVGRIHFLERPDRAPVDVAAKSSGVVCTIRAVAPSEQGDCVAVIGQACRKEDLL
jgi:N2-acetyl-L-2,4-diaminobutanoate deacetylase